MIAIAVVVMAAIALLNGVSSAEEAVTILLLGVSLAVAAVPEGLPAILSLVLAVGVRMLARRNAVMKSLHSVETLGSASVICSDKTGTLTRNEMTLRTVVTPLGRVDLDGVGYSPEGEVRIPEDAADRSAAERAASRVLVTGALANNAQLSHDADDGWTIEGDPTEAAFLVAVRKVDGAHERLDLYHREAEIPFDSERKLMSTQVTHRNGHRRLFTKGAPDVLLERCTHVLVGNEVRPLDDAERARVLDAVEELSGQAFRTLAVAYRDLADGEFAGGEGPGEDAERDLVHLGVVGIMDPPREEVADAIRDAHRAGIRTIMITGDHPLTALRIATDLGIVEPGARAITGTELDELSDEEFAEAAREVSVFARVAPEHKLRIVDALQADRHVVAMTGDGVNDAPALKSADIGVAMGITGTEVTKDAATMILGDDNYTTIVRAVRQGRVIFDNIEKFLRYLLSSNMGEVATVFFGVVLAGFIGLQDAGTGLVVPLLATQILWINLVTDSGPALAMGMDPEIDDVMARAPRAPDDRILDREMWTRIISIGLVMAAATLFTFDIALPGGLVEGSASFVEARTAAFTALVFAQLFNALNARSATTSAFRGMFSNRWLVGAIVLGAVLQVAVVEVPFLQVAFGTTSMGLDLWLIAIAMSSVVLWLDELAKIVLRRRRAAQ